MSLSRIALSGYTSELGEIWLLYVCRVKQAAEKREVSSTQELKQGAGQRLDVEGSERSGRRGYNVRVRLLRPRGCASLHDAFTATMCLPIYGLLKKITTGREI